MSRVCTVCTHPDINIINEKLVAGQPALRVANSHGLKEKAMRNHKDKHLPLALVQAHKIKETQTADGLLLRAEILWQRAWNLSKKAEDEKSYAAAVSAVKECRGLLELVAKLVGELKTGTQINIVYNEEWVQLRHIIWKALERHPAARIEVMQAIAEVIDVDYEEINDGVTQKLLSSD